jgi:gluconokinase
MILLVMGVTGAGKTTVGKLLAQRLGRQFLDADDFHPAANIEKMRRGIALTGADREPWLDAIRAELVKCAGKNLDVVLACSALKERYREKLGAGMGMRICYLKGTYDEIKSRLASRRGHFADESILAGQFADLEEPGDAIVLPARESPEENVREAIRELKVV